jgi:hypothetical protein
LRFGKCNCSPKRAQRKQNYGKAVTVTNCFARAKAYKRISIKYRTLKPQCEHHHHKCGKRKMPYELFEKK